MINAQKLCRKITEIYPEIGVCGIDVDAVYDQNKKAWVVDLRKDNHHLKTHLETEEADLCLEGKQCVSLGIQVKQLVDNVKAIGSAGGNL